MKRHWSDNLPGWPSERQWVTIGIFALTVMMLRMASHDKTLWDVKLFEVAFQALVLTGMLNMILAFHFSANKSDEDKTQNTKAAFDAITATANANVAPTEQGVTNAADAVADAALDKAQEIRDKP